MTITAKEIEQEEQEVANKQYDLFTTETAIDAGTGEEVTILKSIGTYTKAGLESEKENYESQIAGIEEKINAIDTVVVEE